MAKNYLITLMTFIACSTITAMETAQTPAPSVTPLHNTFKGKVITAHNLYKLSVKMPESLAQKVNACVSKPENREIINQLLSLELCNNSFEFNALQGNKTLYAQRNIKNKSKYNYIFCLPGCNFMIRIAGPLNVIRTKIASAYHINPYDQEELAKISWSTITGPNIPVFQHTSCAATYLKLSEIAHLLKHFTFIPTYLCHLDKQPETPCSDQNYITIHETYDTALIVEINKLSENEKKEVVSHMTPRVLKELYCAIHSGPLWNIDIDTNLLLNIQEKNQFVITDFEQPNNSDGSLFFYQGEKGLNKHSNDLGTALNMMQESLEKYGKEKAQLWKELRKTNYQLILEELKKA